MASLHSKRNSNETVAQLLATWELVTHLIWELLALALVGPNAIVYESSQDKSEV